MFLVDTNKWILLSENVNNPTHYAMNRKGVCEYADVEAGTYMSYSLPEEPGNLPPNQASWQTQVHMIDRWCRWCQSTSLLPFFSLFLSFIVSYSRKTYFQTDLKQWTKINNNGDNVQMVDPIPFADTDKDFTVNITQEEIESLKDDASDIGFHRVMELCLPRFDDPEAGQQLLWGCKNEELYDLFNTTS